MEERLQKADRVLCVVSAEYLTKEFGLGAPLGAMGFGEQTAEFHASGIRG
jgi:hypothetical protein